MVAIAQRVQVGLVWLGVAAVAAASLYAAPASKGLDSLTGVPVFEVEGSVARKASSAPRVSPDSVPAFEDSGEGYFFTRLRFAMKGSAAVRLHFEDFNLAGGSRVYVYTIQNGEATNVQGPFEEAGPVASGDFWTRALPGGEAVVELQVAGALPADLPFHVTQMESADAASTPLAMSRRSGAPQVGVAHYRGRDLAYEVHDGLAIFEGDIVLGLAEELEAARGKGHTRQAVAITGSQYRWPGGVVPYTIDAALPEQYRVVDAISHWNSAMGGVVRLIPRTSERNFVHFFRPANPGTCSASVGMQGYGQQNVNIGDYCSTGNTVHEIGHAVGLWHEQSREDRNSYVRILTENIQPDYLFNFNQAIGNGDDVLAYDFASIMHYHAYAFSSNGNPTIETIPAGISIGQRGGLSSGDVEGVKAMYGSGGGSTGGGGGGTGGTTTVSVTFQSNPAGMPITVDGAASASSFSATWTSGTSHTISAQNPAATGSTKFVYNNWSHGGSQTQTVTAPNSATTYTANYRTKHLVNANPGNGGGNVSKSPASADSFYDQNSTVTLTATAASGYCFTGWSGLISGTPSTTSVTVTSPYNVTANFETGAVTVTPGSVTALNGKPSTHSVSVSASSGCSWIARSNVSWISIAQGATGAGNGVVSLRLKTNNSTGPRTGTVTIGNQTVTVYQPR